MENMSTNNNNNAKSNKIFCEVEKCIHHLNSDECAAASINVGPRHACDNKHTECATFMEKIDSTDNDNDNSNVNKNNNFDVANNNTIDPTATI